MSSFRSKLIGTWELVVYTSTNTADPNDVVYPFGKNGKGLVVYSADGYMSSKLQVADAAQYEKGWNSGSQEELAKAAVEFQGYMGPFFLDEKPGNKQIIHHYPKISLPPNWIESTQERHAELVEENGVEYLYLGPTSPAKLDGVERIVKLKWKKVEPINGTKPPGKAYQL